MWTHLTLTLTEVNITKSGGQWGHIITQITMF